MGSTRLIKEFKGTESHSLASTNNTEYELSVDKINAAEDILVEDKLVSILRSRTICILSAINHEY